MNDDSFTPEERALIERLSNAPQPDLTPTASNAIRARMLEAADAPPGVSPTPALNIPTSLLTVVGVAAAVVILIVIVIAAAGTPASDETPLAAPSETSVPTETPVPRATDTPIPTGAATVEVVPQAILDTATPAPTVTATVTPVPTATLESVIVVEGPIQAIDENIIVIFGIKIYFDPENPLLDVIEVGDILHINATYDSESATIVAVSVVQIIQTPNPPAGLTNEQSETNPEAEVNVNPESGEVWQDNGNCDNPPPPWAPANGWRRRCEGANPPGNSGNSNGNNGQNGNNPGNGNGGGNGNGNSGQGKGQGNG